MATSVAGSAAGSVGGHSGVGSGGGGDAAPGAARSVAASAAGSVAGASAGAASAAGAGAGAGAGSVSRGPRSVTSARPPRSSVTSTASRRSGARGSVGGPGAGGASGSAGTAGEDGESSPAPVPVTGIMVGDNVDNFDCDTQLGPLNFYKYISGKFCMLFSHPADFTPVCTTELLTLVAMQPEFEARNAVIIGLSVDPAKTHAEWVRSIEDADTKVTFPIIGDLDGTIATRFNMIHPSAAGTENGRLTIRTVVLIDPEKRVQLIMHYPSGTGRNFQEILRCIDSLTVTLEHQVATPANWAKGEDVVILPSVDEEQAKELFPKGFVAIKPYLRITPDPSV